MDTNKIEYECDWNKEFSCKNYAILNSDTSHALCILPSNFVDLIVTSPPYWGLRDYGEEAVTIWDAEEGCEHEFDNLQEKHDVREETISGKTRTTERCYGDESRKFDGNHQKHTAGQFCIKCGAWRGQLGLEPTLELYIAHLLQITKELKRVLKPTGVMFWNHGDSYGGSGNASGHTEETTNCGKKTSEYGATKGHSVGYKPKCMLLQNFRLIMKIVDEQEWILRNTIIWNKPNHMPSSVKDRFTNGYEPIFMLTKNKKYWFDLDAVREPHKIPIHAPGNKNRVPLTHHFDEPDRLWGSLAGKNPGDVWTIPTQPFSDAHFAVFPEKLAERCIKCGCPEDGIVLDPFLGKGTTMKVAQKHNMSCIGIEISSKYIDIIVKHVPDIPMGKLKQINGIRSIWPLINVPEHLKSFLS